MVLLSTWCSWGKPLFLMRIPIVLKVGLCEVALGPLGMRSGTMYLGRLRVRVVTIDPVTIAELSTKCRFVMIPLRS